MRGARGLSFWRCGVIGSSEFEAINDEKVDAEVGPDQVWRRYGWEKIVAPYESGYVDGAHSDAAGGLFSEFTGASGHLIKHINARADGDTVWAIWRPDLPARGVYEISVYVPGLHATTHQARYHVHGMVGMGGEVLVRLDQNRYYNQWVPLVAFEFERKPEGGQVNLTNLTGETGKEVAFTAVRWRQILEQRPASS
jgi:hypothetical protein